MQTIGGSLFIRNAIEHDYCIEAAIESLVELCDEIVIVDACSDDGTVPLLKAIASWHPKIKLVLDQPWECAPDFHRLSILANVAISHLTTDWHIMLQADEVLHEMSIPIIRDALERHKNEHDLVFIVRRPHVFRHMDYYIRHDLEEERKPSGDFIPRIGRRHHLAYGDAQGIAGGNVTWEYKHQIALYHYSFVRHHKPNIARAIAMMKWFGVGTDARLLDMTGDYVYHPERFYQWCDLKRLEHAHPEVVRAWVDERRKEYLV